jgi:hypothetical protein
VPLAASAGQRFGRISHVLFAPTTSRSSRGNDFLASIQAMAP